MACPDVPPRRHSQGDGVGGGQAVSAGTVGTDGGAGGQKEREWVLEREWRACPLAGCS